MSPAQTPRFGPRADRVCDLVVVVSGSWNATSANVGDVVASVANPSKHVWLVLYVPNLPNVPNLFPSDRNPRARMRVRAYMRMFTRKVRQGSAA